MLINRSLCATTLLAVALLGGDKLGSMASESPQNKARPCLVRYARAVKTKADQRVRHPAAGK
jgi:hypothetical protein